MSLHAIPASQSCLGARPARGGREAPAPWGGGSGAARGHAARKGRCGSRANRAAGGPVGASRSAVPDLIRDLLVSFEAPDHVRGCGGTR
jgi:hypothetical protein